MIGDTKMDMSAAKENRMAALAVSYGYGTKEELLEQKPDFIADSVGEIRSILLTS